MEISKEKQDKTSVATAKLSKTFTPTPITPIKIKEVLNTYFVTFHGLWRTKSAVLD